MSGIDVEHRAGWDLADTGFTEIVNPEARRNLDGGPVLWPVILADAPHDDVFLQHRVPAERVAPGTEDMNSGRPDQVEEHGPELPEVRTRGEAPRRNEYEVPPLPQERGARGHEQRVDVGLPVDHFGDGRRTWVVLADLEVRRIGDDDIERLRRGASGEESPRAQELRVRQDEVLRLDADGDRHSIAPAAPVGQMVEDSPERWKQVAVDFGGQSA